VLPRRLLDLAIEVGVMEMVARSEGSDKVWRLRQGLQVVAAITEVSEKFCLEVVATGKKVWK
jgi:hypothetical protein